MGGPQIQRVRSFSDELSESGATINYVDWDLPKKLYSTGTLVVKAMVQ